tara:strand:- start:6525 stop:8417 length:1893 start_codon:yes stop_codon:yes gene_type:complete
MHNLQNILEKEYKKKSSAQNFETLVDLIEEIFEIDINEAPAVTGAPDVSQLDDRAAQQMILKMIPDIAVSEIGWSDVSTNDKGDAISGPQRQLLVQFLKNVDGSDFAERIKSVSSFYTSGADMYQQSGLDNGDMIAKTISYLVFYKTLTKIITNFNASSAGFSFESFLAALVDGEQIPANTGTIADYIDKATGTDIPVSLKLYREGQLEVGGSYTDLVNDLANPQWPDFGNRMRYVICTKVLSGDGLEQEGQIKFWQFDFTLENVLNILANSKATSQECIRLSRGVVGTLQAGQRRDLENILGLPEKEVFPPAEELEREFSDFLRNIIRSYAQANPQSYFNRITPEAENELINDLQWAQNGSDPLFFPITIKVKDDESGEVQVIDKGIIRGQSKMVSKAVKDWLERKYSVIENDEEMQQLFQVTDEDGFTTKERNQLAREFKAQLDKAIRGANQQLVDKYKPSEKKSERNRMLDDYLKEGEFLSPSESARIYGQLNSDQQKIALLNSLGYLRTLHFSLNQKQATNPEKPNWQSREEPNPNNPKKPKTISGGTGAIYLGEINVGTKYVAMAIKQVREILNEKVAQIFISLKTLSESLNSYFAGGLKNDSDAGAAVSNAENIVTKTEKTRNK